MAALSSAETRGFPQLLQPSAAATPKCFDQVPEKRNPWAPESFDPRAEANLQSSVRRATAPRETAWPGKNGREKSALSKKNKSTPGPTTDDDQARACARKYTKPWR